MLRHALKGPGCHIGAGAGRHRLRAAGIEVIDSRYRDFKFDPKVVADNTSGRALVAIAASGPRANLRTLRRGIVLEKTASPWPWLGAAVLGHPAAAIASWPTTWAGGRELPAGSMILSGGVTGPCIVVWRQQP